MGGVSTAPLLTELHAHTTWSDGVLRGAELVDVYGEAGFDVLCITDHALPSRADCLSDSIVESRFAAYLAEVEREAARARSSYGLVVLPGLELTLTSDDADTAAHALALGLREFVSLDDGIDPALSAARSAGAALVAAHPSGPESLDHRATRAWWRRFEELRHLVDRWELINRHTAYPWVSEARLPVVATGDFHRPEHLSTWKTLLPCEKDAEAVVAYLRSPARCFLTTVEAAPTAEPLAA